jgi:hypothetical protein
LSEACALYTTMDSSIKETIQEYAYEGYTYLYDEEPERMRELEVYLSKQKYHARVLYRRTDYPPFLRLKEGDTFHSSRVSSWSETCVVPNAKYEGIESVLFVLYECDVDGLDIQHISPYPEEREVLLAPCHFKVMDRREDRITIVPR